MSNIEQLHDKVDYLTKLVETLIEESKPCTKKGNNNDNMKEMLKMFNSLPVNNHPMFKQILEPLNDMINKQQG